MAVFVNTGNGIISSRLQTSPAESAEWERDQIYLDLLPSTLGPAQGTTAQGTTLHQAFCVVWEQFEGHQQQAAVCARVLAFHFLMEHTRGRAVEHWLRPSPENPATVILDNAVVTAVGLVPLGEQGQMREDDLAASVVQHSRGDERKEPLHTCAPGHANALQAMC